jgi:hypothetical protein
MKPTTAPATRATIEMIRRRRSSERCSTSGIRSPRSSLSGLSSVMAMVQP